MRNKNFALVALALAAVATACVEKPAERPATPARIAMPAQARPMGAFELTVLPEAAPRGPGMGRPSYPTVWTQMVEGSDGVPGTNPARTIQIASSANFVGFPDVGGDSCAADQFIRTNVRLTNFYPERFVDPYVVITTSIAGNQLCNPGQQPVETQQNEESFAGLPVHPSAFGFLNYVTYNLDPRLSLAGSLVDTGGAGGTPLDLDWAFNYPTTQTQPFTLRGEVWGFPMPDAPTPGGNNLGGYVGRNESPFWNVIDIADDLSKPRVTANAVVVCDVAPGADGSCPGPSTRFAGEVPFASSGLGYRTFAVNLNGASGLVNGNQYYLRAVNRWNNGGGVVTGTFPYQELVRVTGIPAFVAPAEAAVVDNATTFSWTVEFPDPLRIANGVNVFAICPDDTCDGGQFTGAVFIGNTALTAVPVGDTYTFTTPPFSDAAFGALAPNTTYYWTARSAFAGREGPWTFPTRSFTTPPL